MKQRPLFDRTISIILLCLLVSAFICATVYLALIWNYPIEREYIQIVLGILAGIIIIHCIFNLRKKVLSPFIALLLSVILCVTSAVGYYTNMEYVYPLYCIDNPNYEQELIEWEKKWEVKEQEREETAESEYDIDDAIIFATKRIADKPSAEIETFPESKGILDSFNIYINVITIIGTVVYLLYAVYNLIRIVSIPIKSIQNSQRRKRSATIHEKAYAQIDKFHDYLQRGVINQEEYEDNRRRILESLEETT